MKPWCKDDKYLHKKIRLSFPATPVGVRTVRWNHRATYFVGY